MKKIISVIIIASFIISCQKDSAVETKFINSDISNISSAFVKLRSNYVDFKPSSAKNVLQSPSNYDLARVAHYIVNSDDYIINKNTFHEEYGFFSWNWATIYPSSQSEYTIVIPLRDSHKINGLLHVMGDGDHMDLSFVSLASLKEKIVNQSIEEVLSSGSFLDIALINTLNLSRFNKIDNLLNEFISDGLEIIDVELLKLYSTTAWFSYPSTDPDGVVVVNAYSTTTNFACPGGANNGNLGGTFSNGENGTEGGSEDGWGGSSTGSGTTGSESSGPSSILDGLDVEEKECINSRLTNEAFGMLEELENINLPCNDREIEDVLSEVILELCDEDNSDGGILTEIEVGDIEEDVQDKLEQENVTKEDLEGAINEALDGVEKIVLPPGFEEDCPCFSKIFNQLNQAGTGNWLCDIVSNIGSSNSFTQTIEIYDGSKFKNQLDANNNSATLKIPSSACNGTNLQDASKFIHEFLHGHLFNLLFGSNLEGWDEDNIFLESSVTNYPRINPAYWAALVAQYNNVDVVSPNHHALFFTHLQNIIRNAIYELNGSNGSISDYDYMVHLILSTQSMVVNPETGEPAPWAGQLGLVDENGDALWKLNDHLSGWQNIGGLANGENPSFVINCN